MFDIPNAKLYKQLQATKSAAERIGPLTPHRRDPAFIRYLHYARLWNREAGGDDLLSVSCEVGQVATDPKPRASSPC